MSEQTKTTSKFKNVMAEAKKSGFFQGMWDTSKIVLDPLISGYAMFYWTKLPGWVTQELPDFAKFTEKNFKEFSGLTNIDLQSVGITSGYAANEVHIPQSIQKGNNTFTIKHEEFSGSPIRNGYAFWIENVLDPRTGISPYGAKYGIPYHLKNHTGELCYITTRPDVTNVGQDNIEFSSYYSAVMPKTIKLDQFNFSLNEHNATEYDQEFMADFHYGPRISKLAKAILEKEVGKDATTQFVTLENWGAEQEKEEDASRNETVISKTAATAANELNKATESANSKINATNTRKTVDTRNSAH